MKLNQSTLKLLESHCPRFVEEQLNSTEETTEKPLLYGSYFEYKCLGSGARDEVITDLPRQKNGEKYADHTRIDLQVENFKQLKWNITSTQMYLTCGNRAGTIDFELNNDSIVDLKLTKDLDNGYWSGDVDMIQIWHYGELYKANFGIQPKLYYLIYDYSPRLNSKFLEVEISDKTHQEFEQRFLAGEELLLRQEEFKLTTGEWERIPNVYSCSKCKLTCGLRKSNQINYQKIRI